MTLIIQDLKENIKNITFPSGTNNYYENDSADGFAFLGAARLIVGLDADKCYEEIKKRNYTLNVDKIIARPNRKVFKDTQYVYTLWACIEMLSRLEGQGETINFLIDRVNQIGQYENGMMRYCTTEINYIVPNVSSAAALIYSINQEVPKANRLLTILKENQLGYGNWEYKIRGKKTQNFVSAGICEDSYHLAMMVYHLKEITRLTGLDTSSITKRSLQRLREINEKKLDAGSVGWGIPMLALAAHGLDSELYERALNETLSKSIKHTNFRTRSIAAFCLAKIWTEAEDDYFKKI